MPFFIAVMELSSHGYFPLSPHAEGDRAEDSTLSVGLLWPGRLDIGQLVAPASHAHTALSNAFRSQSMQKARYVQALCLVNNLCLQKTFSHVTMGD